MSVTFVNIEQQKGLREDLIDKIVNISPKDRPIMATMGHVAAKAVTHTWTQETLAKRDGTNAVTSGATVTFAAADYTNRTTVSNYTQIPRKKVSADFTVDAVNKAQIGMGERSEFNHQKELKFIELLNDIENLLTLGQTPVLPAPNTGTTGVAGGMAYFITDNVVDLSAAPYNGTLEQGAFDDAAQLAWAQGGSPDVAFAGAKAKRRIASWITQTYRPISDAGKKLVNVINNYETVTGDMDIILSRDCTSNVFIIESRFWNHAWLREPQFYLTGLTGSFTGGWYEAELTVEALAAKSSALIKNVSVS